ncbi:MAG TPA: methyltransferase domain-containing protein [Candidatus Eisenbacteria bacterium]|nr:methyltransferase domain-containing protein [Candidatus Eisenbacteria bacterium]
MAMPHRYAFVSLACSAILASACARVTGCLQPIPFVPTPIEVVDRMLEFGGASPRDIVYDIGSGDGRVVIRAATKYGARAVGIETNGALVEIARAEAKRAGVAHLVEFRHEDALMADVSGATLITLYMLPSFNRKLRPVLEKQLRPGTRIVAHDYPIEGWEPVRWEVMPIVDTRPDVVRHNHILYLYEWNGAKASS